MARRLRHPQGHRAALRQGAHDEAQRPPAHTGYGLFGGQPGRLAETVLDSGEAERIGSKDVRPLGQDNVVSFRLKGGGGFGEARERDPRAVAEDVADGYVSAEAARRTYGRSE